MSHVGLRHVMLLDYAVLMDRPRLTLLGNFFNVSVARGEVVDELFWKNSKHLFKLLNILSIYFCRWEPGRMRAWQDESLVGWEPGSMRAWVEVGSHIFGRTHLFCKFCLFFPECFCLALEGGGEDGRQTFLKNIQAKRDILLQRVYLAKLCFYHTPFYQILPVKLILPDTHLAGDLIN